MNLPIRFPSEEEKLENEARKYREMTPDERMRAMLELSAACEAIRASSPLRDRQTALLDEEERREHERWREVIARHHVESSGDEPINSPD